MALGIKIKAKDEGIDLVTSGLGDAGQNDFGVTESSGHGVIHPQLRAPEPLLFVNAPLPGFPFDFVMLDILVHSGRCLMMGIPYRAEDCPKDNHQQYRRYANKQENRAARIHYLRMVIINKFSKKCGKGLDTE